ncbi:MAG: hypothetical protein ACRCZJ_06740 [Erysipelotrichaceae bacterium]
MDYIDRYINAVLEYLPLHYHRDITIQLRRMIHRMLMENREPNAQLRVKKVLIELGDPEQFAQQLVKQNQVLIGPKYYLFYRKTLQWVECSIVFAITFAHLIYQQYGGFQDVWDTLLHYVVMLTSALAQGFLWVTLVFVAIEFVQREQKDEELPVWRLDDLPKTTLKKRKFFRLATMIELVVATVAVVLFVFSPDIIAVYIPLTQGGYQIVPVFSELEITKLQYLVMGVFILTIARTSMKMLFHRWKLSNAISYALLNLCGLSFVIALVNAQDMFNPNFARIVETKLQLQYSLSLAISDLSMLFTWVFVILYLADTALIMYRCLSEERY